MIHMVALGYLIFCALLQAFRVFRIGVGYWTITRNSAAKSKELAATHPELTKVFEMIAATASAPLRRLFISQAAWGALFVAAVAALAFNL